MGSTHLQQASIGTPSGWEELEQLACPAALCRYAKESATAGSYMLSFRSRLSILMVHGKVLLILIVKQLLGQGTHCRCLIVIILVSVSIIFEKTIAKNIFTSTAYIYDIKTCIK